MQSGSDTVPVVPDAATLKAMHAEAVTLSDIVSRLDARDKEKTVRFELDPVLQDKPIMVYGDTFSKPEVVLAGLAELHGLRIAKPDKTRGRLMPPAQAAPRTLADVPAYLRAVLPAGLVRLLHEPELNALRKLPQPEYPFEQNAENFEKNMAVVNGELAKRQRRRDDMEFVAEGAPLEASRRVRLIVEPQIARDPKAGIPVASFDKADKSALALTCMGGPLRQMRDIFSKPAPLFLRFDEVFVKGGFSQKNGQEFAALALELREPDNNSLTDAVAAFNVRVPPQ